MRPVGGIGVQCLSTLCAADVGHFLLEPLNFPRRQAARQRKSAAHGSGGARRIVFHETDAGELFVYANRQFDLLAIDRSWVFRQSCKLNGRAQIGCRDIQRAQTCMRFACKISQQSPVQIEFPAFGIRGGQLVEQRFARSRSSSAAELPPARISAPPRKSRASA